MLNYTHTVILYILFENSVYYNDENNDHNDNKLYFYKLCSPRLSINEENTNTNTNSLTLSS